MYQMESWHVEGRFGSWTECGRAVGAQVTWMSEKQLMESNKASTQSKAWACSSFCCIKSTFSLNSDA